MCFHGAQFDELCGHMWTSLLEQSKPGGRTSGLLMRGHYLYLPAIALPWVCNMLEACRNLFGKLLCHASPQGRRFLASANGASGRRRHGRPDSDVSQHSGWVGLTALLPFPALQVDDSWCRCVTSICFSWNHKDALLSEACFQEIWTILSYIMSFSPWICLSDTLMLWRFPSSSKNRCSTHFSLHIMITYITSPHLKLDGFFMICFICFSLFALWK